MTGIYLITNTVNGKCYVGQSVDIERRWVAHKKCKNKTPLYNAFRKYGLENFKWDVLLECPEERLDFYEKACIDEYNCISPDGYNLKDGGANGRHSNESKQKMSEASKGKTHTAETKQKMSDAHKGKTRAPFTRASPTAETKQKISDAKKGKTLSEESKQKMSEAKKGKTLSEDHKQHIADAQKGKACSAETKQKISDAMKLRNAKMRDSK